MEQKRAQGKRIVLQGNSQWRKAYEMVIGEESDNPRKRQKGIGVQGKENKRKKKKGHSKE